MKADIPIIGANSPTNQALRLLSADLINKEFRRLVDNELQLSKIMKIHELRKSCGVTDKSQTTINIRRPPRYAGTFKAK